MKIALIIFGIVLEFLVNTAAFALICLGLTMIGIDSIFGWTITFSWSLVIVFNIFITIIKWILKKFT